MMINRTEDIAYYNITKDDVVAEQLTNLNELKKDLWRQP